jgi:hypothetical protein
MTALKQIRIFMYFIVIYVKNFNNDNNLGKYIIEKMLRSVTDLYLYFKRYFLICKLSKVISFIRNNIKLNNNNKIDDS